MAWGDFWEEGNLYGADQDWYTTPLVEGNEHQQGTFLRYLTKNGLDGPSKKGQFAQGLYNKFNTGFLAAAATNPMLSFRDYINGFGGTGVIDNEWNQLTPQQQGKEYGNNFAGNIRIQRRG